MWRNCFELVRVGDEVDLIADPTPEEASLFETAPDKIPASEKIHAAHLQTTVASADGIAEGLQ